MKKVIISILTLILAALGGAQVAKLGAAPGGMYADSATTSLVALGTTAKVIFATSTNCVSRLITGPSDADVWFEVADEVPIVGTSHKIASTTEDVFILDSAIFGCGAVRALSADGTSANVTEFTSFR